MAKKKVTKTTKTTVKKTVKTVKATKAPKAKSARKPNAAFMKPKKFTEELGEIVGKGPLPRTEITKKLWAYIKKYKLQDPKSPRMIVPDEKLSKVLGKKTVDMFKMTALVNKHILD
jgi:chromatin remodeling complex protein RSC6